MPTSCCVMNCMVNAKKDEDVKFYRIPTVLSFKHRKDLNDLSVARKKRWLDAINRKHFTGPMLKYARVCSRHFISGKPATLEDQSNPDWVPSLNMGHSKAELSVSKDVGEKRFQRYERTEERTQKKFKLLEHENVTETTAGTSGEDQVQNVNINYEEHSDDERENITPKLQNKASQTDIDSAELSLLMVELNTAKDLIKSLRERVMCVENIKGDDNKTKYCTGLPHYKLFEQVVDFTKPFVAMHGNTSLSAKEQVLLTLIKMRLNLDLKDLAYRFHIHPTTSSTYFKNIIHIMAQRFKSLVFWPERSILMKTMPRCFKESFHDKTTVIIDCFEIRCERPSNLRTAAEVWSNYKHCETIKYLIGIKPQGSICFISKGWGGRTSDKFITQNSSFLENLCPGDVLLADRGFLIKEFVELFHASVKIPAFTRGKSQLDAVDLEETRGIAHVRIHVERIISLIRQKFRILDGTLPITLLCSQAGEDKVLLDEIVLVACALINLCPPVVPQ